MLVWVGDIRQSDCFRLSHQLGASGFPFCAVLAPTGQTGGSRDYKVSVVLRSMGVIAPEDLVQQLV